MRKANISEVKAYFSKLPEDVSKGNVILIAKLGLAIEKLIGICPSRSIRINKMRSGLALT